MDYKSGYKEIFKTTSIFGFVQLFQIIVGIIRTKIIAIILGPTGMGINGLFLSNISLVSTISNFGLSTSAVKEISKASNNNDIEKLNKSLITLKTLLWFTGLLGAFLSIIFANILSKLAFGSEEYKSYFYILSIVLILNQLNEGRGALLRGLRKVKEMAKASIFGSFLGLIITIPIYYYYGIDGIVPSIIISSLIGFILTYFFSKRFLDNKIKPNFSLRVFYDGAEMIKMGFLFNLSNIFSIITAYSLRIYISNNGGIDEVGFYNAGFAILTTYLGMIFTSMSTDFFPKINSTKNFEELKKTISEQLELSIIIIMPLICLIITFIDLLISLLYTKEFQPISYMIQLASLGFVFRSIGTPLAFVVLSKCKPFHFFISETLATIYFFFTNIIFYKFFGLTGLGIAYLLNYFLYFIQLNLILKVLLKFNIARSVWLIFIINSLVIVVAFFIKFLNINLLSIFIFITSLIIGFILLNNRIDILKAIKLFRR